MVSGGVYKGRQASIDAATVREAKAQGFGPTAIARRLGSAERVRARR